MRAFGSDGTISAKAFMRKVPARDAARAGSFAASRALLQVVQTARGISRGALALGRPFETGFRASVLAGPRNFTLGGN
jgi:hypothetical protein